MDRLLLFLPGPMQVPESVAEAAKRPLFFHRSEQFDQFRSKLTTRVQPLFGTQSDILFLSSSGTGAMESAVANLTSPGEAIIVMVGGTFAERWARIGKALGLTVRVADVDPRTGPSVDDVNGAMDRWPDAQVVFTTWSESSTGVLMELDEIGRAVRLRKKYLVTDAVSGLAVSPMQMDAWNVDAVVAGSQKGLMLPPGLGVVAVGTRAWERAATSTMPRFYWDWDSYRHSVPVTPPMSIMFQLEAALDFMDTLGPGGLYARRAEVAGRIREMVERNGLELYAKRTGNGITAVLAPDRMDVDRFLRRLEEDYSILIAGVLGPLKGKMFRIGHVGQVSDEEVDYFIQSFEKALALENG